MTENESRLTKRNPDGSVGINDFRYYNYADFQKLANKLAEFEDIGTIEEFKALKKEVELYRNLDKTNFSDGYAKAIDEFVKLADECSGYTANCIEHDLALTIYTIHQIAEQMKAGGKNE